MGVPVPSTKAVGAKLGVLELSRFVAAFIVLITHLRSGLNGHAAAGAVPLFGDRQPPAALAVSYFFVLSGFVMFVAHYRDFGSFAAVPRFWWRRACRIYPVYWLALAIPVYYWHNALTPGLTLQVLTLSPFHSHELVATAWSLRFEITFYLAFGLCLLPRVGLGLLALWVIATFWLWTPAPLPAFLHLQPPDWVIKAAFSRPWDGFGRFLNYADCYFFAGLAAGFVFVKYPPGRRTSLVLAVMGGVLLLVALPEMHWGFGYATPPFALWMGLLLAAIILGLSGLEEAGWLRPYRHAKRLGAMSYPLYILHVPLIFAADQMFPAYRFSTVGLYIGLFIGVAIIYAVTVIITFGFDRPLQRALSRLTLLSVETVTAGPSPAPSRGARRRGSATPPAPALRR